MNLAQAFTFSRLILGPLLPILYLGHEWLGISFTYVPYSMLCLLLICESSDIFDGFFARRWNQVTDLGKILDPVADSLIHMSLFIAFTQGVIQLPLSLVFVFLYRELFVAALRTLCALRGVALSARASGKVKTFAHAIVCVGMVVLMIPYAEGAISASLFQSSCLYLAVFAAFWTMVSLFDYLYANRDVLRRAFSTKQPSVEL